MSDGARQPGESSFENNVQADQSPLSFVGFLIIDKPHGWTSFDCVNKIRGTLERGLRAKYGELPGGAKRLKVGHSGTLDPYATGVLVVAVGKATKMIEELKGCDKDYVAEIGFGLMSETYDLDGEVKVVDGMGDVADPDGLVCQFDDDFVEQLESMLPEFVGEIQQIPPRFSALKVDGKRAYDLARKGKDFELAARTVHIERLDILGKELRPILSDHPDLQFPVVTLQMTVSTGTYIRSLARDIGEKLGIPAVLTGLRRTRVGKASLGSGVSSSISITPPSYPIISLSKETTFEELAEALIPVEEFMNS